MSLELECAAALFPAEFVRRRRLVTRMRDLRGALLTVIVAPPGYGKSALIAEWAEADDRRFVWLRLEPSDSSEHAAERVARICELARAEADPCVVVLDDAHRVAPDILRSAVTSMWKSLPANSMVAVASRTDVDLPLGRLRAHRALVEVRMRELAMAPAEASVLLHRAGAQLDFEDVEALVHLTEGWPAALYLAALSLAEPHGAPEELSGFRGDDHLLAEYLRDDVLDALPRASVTFLRRASVLDELTGDACDAVLGERRSALKLARLAGLTGLLEPCDPAHERYRWHRLFRETLRAELWRREPDRALRLHAAASVWHADHGETDRAIEHAVAAGDAARTGELLWDTLRSHVTGDGIARVQRWLDEFTTEAIAAAPELALCAACASLISGHAEAALHWTREIEATTHEEAPPEAVTAALRLVEAMTAGGGITMMRTASARARRALRANDPWLPACVWLEGVAAHLGATDRRGATVLLEQAAELAGRSFPAVTTLAVSQRTMIAMEDGDWHLAVELADETTALIGECRPPLPIEALALAAAAAARARQGRVDEAKEEVLRVVAALAELDDAPAWLGAQTRLLLAHASLYLADVTGARTLLAQASRQARRAGPVPTFERWFDDAWAYLDTMAEASLAGPSTLTIAELRVLRFLPSCRPFREIADQLGVSANTVKTQAHAIYRKLGAGSRSEAVQLAREAGLLGQ